MEGKVVRLKPDRMRSKVTASYRPMATVGSFDLISQPLRAASFPSRGSLSSEHRSSCALSVAFYSISFKKLLPGVSSVTPRASATVAAMSQKPTRVPRAVGLIFLPATRMGVYSLVWTLVAV